MTTDLTIDAVVSRMQDLLDALPPEMGHQRTFLLTYQRTTVAVGKAIRDAAFEDPDWVERWDAVFANLYLDALDAHVEGRTADVPRPWRLAFDADPALPVLRHELLGINAHINYDLPQAMLAVIDKADFNDQAVLDRAAKIADLLAPGQVILKSAISGFGVTLPPL